jgi:hypothetical protein
MTLIESHNWGRIAPNLFVRVAGGFAIWDKKLEAASKVVLRAGDALRKSQTVGARLGEGAQQISRRFRGSAQYHEKTAIPEEILRELFS